MKESPVKIDVLLEPLLAEASDEQVDALLSQLITVHAEPVIKGVIRFKLRLNSYRETQRAEADDIQQEVVLQLLAQLQRFRKLPSGHPISDVRGMAAVIAHRTCARWMRRQFPERHALKNRLHYLMTRQRGFALWQDQDGKLVAGFEVWREQKQPARNFTDVEKLPAHIRALVVSPHSQLPTHVARAALPRTVSRQDAVYNLQRSALFIAAIAQQGYDMLWEAMGDRLHQPHRESLVPGLREALAIPRMPGLLGIALSGAGPSIVALVDNNDDEIGARITSCFERHGIRATTRVLEVDNEGCRVMP